MIFVITAGHSDKDPGAIAGTEKEANIATKLRDMVAAKLRALGHTVYEDGEDGVNLPLAEAIKLVPKGIAVEFHCNAAVSATARGVETISLPGKKELAQQLSKAIAAVTKDKVRGEAGWIDQSKSARGKLGYVSAGGLIVELFFLSNKESLVMYEANRGAVADAVVKVLTS